MQAHSPFLASLILERDLLFANVTDLQGLGTVLGHGNAIDLCCSITKLPEQSAVFDNLELRLNNDLTINSPCTFKGLCALDGDKNILTLGKDACFIIEKNSVLELRNIVFEDLVSDTIKCVDSTAKVRMLNCRLEPFEKVISSIEGSNFSYNGSVIQIDNYTIKVASGDLPYRFLFPGDDCPIERWCDFCDEENECSSRLEELKCCFEQLTSRQEELRSQFNLCASLLDQSIDVLHSELETCLDELPPFGGTDCFSLIEDIAQCFDTIASSTLALQMNMHQCCLNATTSVHTLQSHVDDIELSLLDTIEDDDFLHSRLDELDGCFNTIDQSFNALREQFNVCFSTISTGTQFLQSQLEELATFTFVDDPQFASRLEQLSDVCNDVRSRLSGVQEDFDYCSSFLSTRTILIQSQLDALKYKEEIEDHQSYLDLLDELNNCFDTLGTKTGLIQESINDCCHAVATSTGELQSQIDDLMTSVVVDIDDSFLSRIDNTQDCCDQVQAQVGWLNSQFDACCSSLKTATGELQSHIDELGVSLQTRGEQLLASRIDTLEDCFGDACATAHDIESALDACLSSLKTSTGELQSQLDDIFQPYVWPTSELQDRLDEVESCCDQLATHTGQLQSLIDIYCSLLQTSTGELQSQIDIIETMTREFILDTGFISHLEGLEDCCQMLKTATGDFDSAIASCCDDLLQGIAEIRIRLGYFDYLKTLTGEFQSYFDECCSSLGTSTTELQSQIDALTTLTITVTVDEKITSLLDSLEDCCDRLHIFVDGAYDRLENLECERPSSLDCCQLALTTSLVDNFERAVLCVDWSFDGKFLAVGLEDSPDDAANENVKIYELMSDGTLKLRASHSFNNPSSALVVKWHPRLYRLAVGSEFAVITTLEQVLQIFNFDPISWMLSNVTQTQVDQTVVFPGTEFDPIFRSSVLALAWHPTGIAGVDAIAFAQEDISSGGNSRLRLYSINSTGQMLAQLYQTGLIAGLVQHRAMDWDLSGDFLAIGLSQGALNDALRVYELVFGKAGPVLELNAAIKVPLYPDNFDTVASVLAVAWHKKIANCLTVGLAGSSGSNIVQLFEHFPNDADQSKRLIRKKCNLFPDLEGPAHSLDWSSDGLCLLVGGHMLKWQLRSYVFDAKNIDFTLQAMFDDLQINSARFTPDALFAASGNLMGDVLLYQKDCIVIVDLVSKTEELIKCCDELTVRRDMLISQVDSIA